MIDVPVRVDVALESAPAFDTSRLERGVALALSREGAVEIIITSSDRLEQLNQAHRGIPSPTDVLTFPAPEEAAPHLGEIAISWHFCQMRDDPQNEAALLAIHGALHLAGMEDDTEEGRSAMIREMNRIAEEVGLTSDPDWHSVPH